MTFWRRRAARMARACILLAGMVLSCLLCQAVQAEESRPDVLYISGQLTAIESSRDGGGGGVEWLHPLSAQSSVNLGAFAFSLAGSTWAYGRVGGALTVRDGTTVSGEVNLGAGEDAEDEAFTYQIYKAEVTHALIDRRLYVAAEDQYFHVGSAEENLIKAGVILAPVDPLTIRLSYYFATGGNINSEFASGRVDFAFKPVTLIAGVVFGQTSPERLNVISGASDTVSFREFFAGVGIPVGRNEVTVVLDGTEQAGIWRVSAYLTWKIPL